MKKLISAAEAAGMVKDGMTVMIGGFLGNGSPHAIIDALVARTFAVHLIRAIYR